MLKTTLKQVFLSIILVVSLAAASGFQGCASTSPTTETAKKGAIAGAVAGGIIGHQSGRPAEGAAIGGATGAVVGGIIGMAKEAKQRNQQEQVAQERAHQQELAKVREIEAREKLIREEKLAIAEGLRITDRELALAEERARETEVRLQDLRGKVNRAKERKKTLEEAKAEKIANEEEIRRLEEQLRQLEEESAHR